MDVASLSKAGFFQLCMLCILILKSPSVLDMDMKWPNDWHVWSLAQVTVQTVQAAAWRAAKYGADLTPGYLSGGLSLSPPAPSPSPSVCCQANMSPQKYFNWPETVPCVGQFLHWQSSVLYFLMRFSWQTNRTTGEYWSNLIVFPNK